MHTDYLTLPQPIEYVTEPVVRVENVVKEFSTGEASFRALDGVSLEIHRGAKRLKKRCPKVAPIQRLVQGERQLDLRDLAAPELQALQPYVR